MKMNIFDHAAKCAVLLGQRITGFETYVAYDRCGKFVSWGTGTDVKVDISDRMKSYLSARAKQHDFDHHHSHPYDWSFSVNDANRLIIPGYKRMWVHTNHGSTFGIRLKVDPLKFTQRLNEIDSMTDFRACKGYLADEPDYEKVLHDQLRSHAIHLIMSDEGLIEYVAELSPGFQTTLNRHARLFRYLVDMFRHDTMYVLGRYGGVCGSAY